METRTEQTFLDPGVLAGIASLELIARTVVDGFVAGLHRSPDFGFSQEFAEYRAYAPGDDLRHVDWNVFARTERAYLKRYRGETNSQLTVLLDASNSMRFGTKLNYARYLAAALLYLAIHGQRDAAGLIVFDDEVRDFVRPSTRAGQLARLLASLEAAAPRARTNFAGPLAHFQQFLHRRGLAVVISDFYGQPEELVRAIEPLRFHGNDVLLFHLLDPGELEPKLDGPALLVDMETGQRFEVTPEYARGEYRDKLNAHLRELAERARGAGLDYALLPTNKPLDLALREYLTLRQGQELMGFLAPWFLLGMAGLAGPLYLHLLRRQTTNPLPFSSLMFFEPRTQASMRHRRLRYLWLLALRLALLALLVLAFADPYLWRPAAAASGRHLTVLVVDRSFSMQARDGGQSRLAAARQQALATLAGVRGPVEVMALGAHLDTISQPGADRAALRGAIVGIQPGFAHADFGELARGLRVLASSAGQPIVVHLFSDFLRTSMPANFVDLTLPAGVTLVPHRIGTSAPNWTIESVQAPGELWGSPTNSPPARVEAEVAGFDTPAATRTVALVVNGKQVATQTVAVPASGRARVVFDGFRPPYGWSECVVRLEPTGADTFPADDGMDFAVRRADPQRVLFIHDAGDRRSSLYFGTALQAGDRAAYHVEAVSAGDAAGRTFGAYALVVLADVPELPAEATAQLREYVRQGGGLLIATGADTRQLPVFGGTVEGGRNYNENYLAVGQSDPSYPATALLGSWPGVRFFYANRIAPGGARVVATLSDGTPLLLDRRVGAGHVVVFASGFDDLTNDFPLHASFVPFIQETARYLAGDASLGPQTVGAFLTLRTARESGIAVQVTDPGGRHPLSLAQATTAKSLPMTEAGFYRLRLADGREQVAAVNPDRRESDLSPIPAETLDLWRGAPRSAPASAGQPAPALPARTQVSIWWYIMLLLLAVAAAESVVAARYLSVRRDVPELAEGQPAPPQEVPR